MIYAHSLEFQSEENWEPLGHHLGAVGARAARYAEPFGAGMMALAMGLLHDIGKCSAMYQAYIRRPTVQGGPKGPDHSTAGAKQAFEIFGPAGRLMGFGIAGHHGGLMNGDGFRVRLGKEIEEYDGWEAHALGLPSPADLTASLQKPKQNQIEKHFSTPFLARMLFSCLVDADFLETEAFYAKDDPPARGGRLQPEHLVKLRAFLARHRKVDSQVNQLRSHILDHANAKAALAPGLFTLTVPTGGGKTLTSLSFAMEHAARHGLRRVIYVIPFTSIIEQTAAVFREDVGLGDAVLEHHASFDWDQRRPPSNDFEEEGSNGLAKLRRDAENWDAPIVVTTAVQFFESLFAARTSKARKLHNLAQSVIVLDEAQSIPVHLLRPCMAAIEELARNYGASVILCTATQPALRQQDAALPRRKDDAVDGLHIPDERELAPDPAALYQQLKRVRVEWLRDPVDDAVIAARFAEQSQMLCIVNSRAHAQALFEQMRSDGMAGAAQLTTLMCAQHRREVLADLREALKAGKPVRLVSTSLIEAGVDISFPEVWRAAAGLFSVAQAAGRCNRSGELGALGEAFGRTVLFESAQHKTPRIIESFYEPARQVLRQNWDDPLGLEAVRAYYQELYCRKGPEALDAGKLLSGDRYPILPALAQTWRDMLWPFADIAEAFRMIDDVMDPVIIPFDDGVRADIDALYGAPVPPAGVTRRLQRYVVPVPSRVRSAMIALGAVQLIKPEEHGDRFAALVNESLYDAQAGLRLDDPTWRTSESNVFG